MLLRDSDTVQILHRFFMNSPSSTRLSYSGCKFFLDPVILLLVLCFSALLSFDAEADWLLDETKFHISAHGQLSCIDCHEDNYDSGVHPSSSEVNKRLEEFFQGDACATCHDEVLAEVENGRHGNTILRKEEFTYCIRCHDPHYQLRKTPVGSFDSSIPARKQCGACHKAREELPGFSPEDTACLACHRAPEPDNHQRADTIFRLCFHCHRRAGQAAHASPVSSAPLLDASAYSITPHAEINCLDCHIGATKFRHNGQERVPCTQCHVPHPEEVAHDAHLSVACEACHLPKVVPIRDVDTGQVSWQTGSEPHGLSAIHGMTISSSDSFCRRCHVSGNTIGAAAHLLPAKSVICMPCHAATFGVGDTITLFALGVFLLGCLMPVLVWCSGSWEKGEHGKNDSIKNSKTAGVVKKHYTFRIADIIKALVLDILLQRRLYQQSKIRWGMHALIFYPFFFRLLWGSSALLCSHAMPGWDVTWMMVDKNNPLTALLFDVSGIMILFGIALAAVRSRFGRSGTISGLPGRDWPALILMGGIVVIGFILEGMRMAMTGLVIDAGYAFIGYWISGIFMHSSGLIEIYSSIWYMHAILVGVLVAYLPFSRLFHVVIAPLVLIVNAACGYSKENGKLRENHLAV